MFEFQHFLKLVYFYVSKAFFSQTHPFGIKKGRFWVKNGLKMKKTPKKLDVFSSGSFELNDTKFKCPKNAAFLPFDFSLC